MVGDLAAKRTEGEAQANFALANVDGVAESAVKTDASECDGRRGEEGEQHSAETILGKSVIDLIFKRADAEHRPTWLNFLDFAANSLRHGQRIRGASAH